jgi:hypothetical protein
MSVDRGGGIDDVAVCVGNVVDADGSLPRPPGGHSLGSLKL